MMKRLLCVFFALLLFLTGMHACAGAAFSSTAFMPLARGATGAAVREIQSALVCLDYLSDAPDCEYPFELGYFDEETEFAVEWFQEANGLEVTGFVDEEAFLLLRGALPGNTRSSASQTKASTSDVWIPTRGGTKYHRSFRCSGMKDPRSVPLNEAQWLGFTACKKCY